MHRKPDEVGYHTLCKGSISEFTVLYFHVPSFSVNASGVKDWLLYASYIKAKCKIQLCSTRQKRYLSVTCLVLLCCYYLHSGTRI